MTTSLTDAQRDHVIRIVNRASEGIVDKYTRGQAEHGGSLIAKAGLHAEAWNEAVDLIVYLSTLREQLVAIHARMVTHPEDAAAALGLLLYGSTADTLPGGVIAP